jgi:hypothetical protein
MPLLCEVQARDLESGFCAKGVGGRPGSKRNQGIKWLPGRPSSRSCVGRTLVPPLDKKSRDLRSNLLCQEISWKSIMKAVVGLLKKECDFEQKRE